MERSQYLSSDQQELLPASLGAQPCPVLSVEGQVMNYPAYACGIDEVSRFFAQACFHPQVVVEVEAWTP